MSQEIDPDKPPVYHEIRCALCGASEGLRIVPVKRFHHAIVATVNVCQTCLNEHNSLSLMFVDPYDAIKIKG